MPLISVVDLRFLTPEGALIWDEEGKAFLV